MNRFRARKSWIVLIAILLLFAACKGESPTAPPPGGGTPPGGSTPPTGANLVLAVSNATPLVDSTVIVTATVTQNNQPVPNGTAVEFSTSAGVLNGGGTATIKTTTDGVATVSVTSGTPGPVRITATVNNITRQVDVAFQTRPTIPPPVNTTPTITSVTPAIGRPQGGEVIRITGTNFKSPVRVLFNTGGATAVEASVQAVSETLIEVITPPVNLGAGQQLIADVIVLTQAGSASEQRAEAADAFTYRNEQLTPSISTVTPNSGPIIGGTRVSILGEGFQQPVQVLFDTAEARVITVQFNEIIVETPAGRDTSPDGSGTVTGPVPVTVRNINSATSATMAGAFHYKAAMAIVVAGPGGGPTSGGTRVTIEGIGFVPPVSVVVRTGSFDVPLAQISVTGTKIIAITPAVQILSCDADLQGPIVVTNVANGDSATGPIFKFDGPNPTIATINPSSITQGVETSINIVIVDPAPGAPRFKIGDKTLFPTSVTVNGDGSVTYAVPVPSNFTFETETCPTGGARQVPLDLDVVYSTSLEGCEDTVEGALTVNPADPSCVVPPAILGVTPVAPTCAAGPSIVAVGPATGTANITVTNAAAAGSQSLTVAAATASPVNGTFSVAPTNAVIAPGGSQVFQVTIDPTAAGAYGAQVNFTSNGGNASSCVSGNGT